MADIRINALATTAASTASDDFVAVDGSANGTRKLNAYSPTFGGNLTVGGTGTFSNTLTASKGLEAGVDGTASQFSGNIAVNNGKGVFLYEPGTTTWLRFYSSTAGTLLLTDASATRQTWTSTGSTLAGNLTVSGTGTSSVGGLFDANAGLRAVSAASFSASTGKGVEMLYISTSDIGYVQSYDRTASAYKLLNVEGSTLRLNSGSGGNVLVGTPIDSGNGKLQLATHTTSAGGIGFGTETSLFRGAGGNLCLNDTGTNAAFSLCNAGTKRADFYAQGSTSTLIIGPITAGWSTVLMSGAGTTALTLDSSQRCILAGALRLNNAYVSGAPTATGYVTLQDSAGNTYKVLVGT